MGNREKRKNTTWTRPTRHHKKLFTHTFLQFRAGAGKIMDNTKVVQEIAA